MIKQLIINVQFITTTNECVRVLFPHLQGNPRVSFTQRASLHNAYRFDGAIQKDGGVLESGETLRLVEMAELALVQNGYTVATMPYRLKKAG